MGIDYMICKECGEAFPDVISYRECPICEEVICGSCSDKLIEKYGCCNDKEFLDDWGVDYEEEEGEEFWSDAPKSCSECAGDVLGNEKYIGELEKLLIFMCNSYEEMQTIVFKKQPELRVEVPMIQGFELNIAISKLAKMEIVDPVISMKTMVKKIEENRK